MPDNDRSGKTFRDQPAMDYIMHEVPWSVFEAQFIPIAKTHEFNTVISLGWQASFANPNDQRALDLVKSQIQKLLPMPLETNDDVVKAATGISSRIISDFEHHPGIDF